jgi:heme exporter protein A
MTLASGDLGSLGMAAMTQPMPASEAFQPHLSVTGLTVRRGERLLFADLRFELKSGNVLLLRGPNGVGKSTLLLALAGIVRPDGGTIAGAERTELHLLNYQSGLKGRLTVSENLEFWQAMNGTSGPTVEAALDAVGIGGLGMLEAGYLSSGQLRRLSLARLLVSARPIWLLDEPSAALDAEGEMLLGRLIDAHRQRGGIAVIATHHDLMLADTAGVETLILGGAA